jgi:hypothetical protein
LYLDRWIDFSAISCGTMPHLVVAEIPRKNIEEGLGRYEIPAPVR